MVSLPTFKTLEKAVEYGEKGSRLVDYSLALGVALLPNCPPWVKKALHTIHHSRDLIELGTCAKELYMAYRGVGLKEKENSRLHGSLHPFERGGESLICFSAVVTPLAIFHEWLDLPLGRYADMVDKLGRWSICLGHAVSVFGAKKEDKADLVLEALFFAMEALGTIPGPFQGMVGASTGAWGLWRIPQQH